VKEVCYSQLGFLACCPALLAAADLIAVALAITVRTPLLTEEGTEVLADKVGMLVAARRKGTELGFVKMFDAEPSHILGDNKTGCHSIGCACHQHVGHCDRCVSVLRYFWKLHLSL
jgi:hypothetical protein